MKILIINYEFPPLGGGGGVGCYQIAKELAKRHKIDVLTSGYKNLPTFEKREGLGIYRVPTLRRKTLTSATNLSMLSYLISGALKGARLKPEGYDLIHTFFGIPSGPLGLVLSKLYNTPHVLTLIGGEIYDQEKLELEYCRNPLVKKIMCWVTKSPCYLTAISKDTADGTKKWLKLKNEIKIIPLGLEKPRVKFDNVKKIKKVNDRVKLITVARLVRRKGLTYLLEWMRELDKDKFELHIVGDGEEREILEKMVKNFGLGKNVFFHGWVTEEKKCELLSQADIFVLPTLHEGLGLVYLEALYFGLPIVTYNNGGHLDFLVHGENGFLAPIYDIKESVGYINLLAENQTLYKKIAENNRVKFREFLIPKVASKYEGYFFEVLKK